MPWRMGRRRAGSAAGAVRRPGLGGMKAKLILMLVVAAIPVFKYVTSCQQNPHIGRRQSVAWTPEQGVELGMRAAPQMIQQHGGELRNPDAQALVDDIGFRLVQAADVGRMPYQFEFTVLADNNLVNAFALPGGQVFITRALLRQLETEGAVAGVLGHEIAHVVARHGAERAAKQQLTQGLTMAAILGAGGGGEGSARMAQLIGGIVNMKFGRDQELESDRLGVLYMANAGYDPRSLIQVMKVLEKAGGGGKQPEFFSTHPSPDNRIERIKEAIDKLFPRGVPDDLQN